MVLRRALDDKATVTPHEMNKPLLTIKFLPRAIEGGTCVLCVPAGGRCWSSGEAVVPVLWLCRAGSQGQGQLCCTPPVPRCRQRHSQERWRGSHHTVTRGHPGPPWQQCPCSSWRVAAPASPDPTVHHLLTCHASQPKHPQQH